MMKREPIVKKQSTDYTDSFINLRNLWMVLLALIVLVDVHAQQPASSPSPQPSSNGNGDALGHYGVVSSIEFGYRGISVDGDHNKYRSDLNYGAGPRLFDTSFLLKAKEGHNGGLFDSLLVTSTGWGADPHGQMRISVENPKWYRFDGSYRWFKYFRFLNTLANPNWVFSPSQFSVLPKPTTGEHGIDAEQKLGDFDLTILPKNDLFRFNVGFSPERYSGPAFTNYHVGGNEFLLLSELRSRANDFRFGADGKLGPIDYSFRQGFRRFRDDSFIDLGRTPGINVNPTTARLISNAVIEYFFNGVRHPQGRSLYFMRNNFFFVDTVSQLTPRATLYIGYRINKDNGQGNRISTPISNPSVVIEMCDTTTTETQRTQRVRREEFSN